MPEPTDEPDVYLGIDVGKSFHHAVALYRGGEVVFDQPLPGDAAEMREVISSLRQLG